MSRHTQGSLAIVGAIAAAVFLVAFVALFVLSEFSLSAAVFLAAIPAAIAAVVLYRGFAGGEEGMAKPAPVVPRKPAAAPVATAAPVAPAPEPTPEPEPTPTPEPTPAPAAAVASAEPGGKPAGLDGPRDGAADDLKLIKGVGPKLEKLLNSMGFWHFDQIASWGEGDVAWVDENLEGFKGRVTRDNWVAQSQTLAAGGGTEFSKRVEDGGVY